MIEIKYEIPQKIFPRLIIIQAPDRVPWQESEDIGLTMKSK